MNSDRDEYRVFEAEAPPDPGWRLLGGGLVFSIAILTVLFLAQVQLAGGPRTKVVAPPPIDTPPTSVMNSGDSFASYAEFIAHHEREGFVFLGRFDDAWPATVIDERTAMNEISFMRQNGTRHTYPGYDGYQLKAVRLRTADGHAAIVVLRSKKKY